MSQNDVFSPDNVRSIIKKTDRTCNGPGVSKSSPVYGTRKTAESSHEKTSNGGGEKESGFQMAPNSIKGPRRR